MRHFRSLYLLSGAIASLVIMISLMAIEVRAQDSLPALERGFRTGYSDGYMAGYRDDANHSPREFGDEEDYNKADRAYDTSYGPLEDYQNGYKQGFEKGYEAGFDHRGFDSTIPRNITRREVITADQDPGNGSASGISTSGSGRMSTGNEVVISSNTEMIVELLTNLSSDASHVGDRFQARVLGPAEFEGAMIDGRVTGVKRPGKVKGTAEIQLAFEQIRLPDNRWADMSAQVTEVIDMGNDAGSADSEGGVKGKDSTSSDVKKVGAASGIGAIIGAIAGGGKGAAIGAAIGGAASTGGVLATRGKELRLPQGQQLRIRTNSETRIK